MDGEGLGAILGLLMIIGIIYLIVVYVIPFLLGLAAVILAIFGLIGAILGLFFAIRNFVVSVREVQNQRSQIGKFKSREIQKRVHNEAPSGNYSDFVYEECASKSYFLGPCFTDIWLIIKGAFIENFSTFPDFSRGEEWYGKIAFFVWSICQLIAQFVLGTVATAALALIMLIVSIVFTDILYIFFGIVLLIENAYLKIKSVSFRCQKCTHAYDIPVYCCPKCGINHVRLRPGRYGVFKRKCVCGSKLPLTVKAKGKYLTVDPATSQRTWTKFKIEDMRSLCPYCGNEDNAGITHPISIALIGGASAGKTTFKVAFLKDFLDEEIVKYNIDYEFPSADYESEFKRIESYYRGLPIPPTQHGTEYDIITFSFFLKHKKFGVDRLIHLYDMPGESFQRGDAQEGWHMYTFNDGAVFLIDPYSLTKIREESQNEIKGSSMGISAASMNELIEALIDTLRQVRTPMNRRGKFTIPIALTINKADSLRLKQQIGDEAIKKLMNAHPDVFHDYYMTMDYLCRCFLVDNGCSGFISNLDANFETVHFFSSSPIGSVPKGARTPFYPINVLPIMQWLMLRTDDQLASVWKPEAPVQDLSEEQRNLYQTDKSYYDTQIANLIPTNVTS